MNNIENSKGEIVMYQPDETIRLEVRMGEESVWLTQQQMAELFDKDRTVIGRHIRNIYKEEELEQSITCAKFAHMGSDGNQHKQAKTATIYTRPLSAQQQLDVQCHNQQYPPITINICQRNHDRFLIIDDDVYIFGASLKDAGKRLFAYIRMQETSATDLLSGIR